MDSSDTEFVRKAYCFSSDCIAASAKSKLNDQERRLVVAQVSRDTTAIMNFQKSMPGDSLLKVMTFLSTTPQKCAGR